MFNKITVIGHLGQDPRMVTGDHPSLSFSIATNESYKGRDGNWVDVTQWHNVQIWGKFAEVMVDKLQKGDLVLVTGPYRSNKGKNRSGDEVTYYNIRAEVVKRLNKREKQTTTPPPDDEYPRYDPSEPTQQAPPVDDDDDSIPF